jgi:hypothetical protein
MTVNRTSDKAKFRRPTSGPSRGGASFGLEDAVGLWPTPMSYAHGEDTRPPGLTKLDIRVRGMYPGDPNYWPSTSDEAQTAWPTPGAADAKGARRHKAQNPTLVGAVAGMWATPNASDANGARSEEQLARMRATSAEKRTTPGGRASYSQLREAALDPERAPAARLSPSWVEALMGFPIGWTEVSRPAGLLPRARRKLTGSPRARRKPSAAEHLG